MTVLSVAVTTKSGKLLLSRQYVNLSRVRIEGLLASFPKLIGTEQQHTYVETDNVRYVYQPVESLYVLMITTKGSNIVEDLETLRLLGKVLPEYSPRYGVVDEDTVLEAAFEIICSFDEVIDWGGARESVNLSQIATYTEMYSHEERLAKMIQESKMQEAKEDMKRKAAALRNQKGDGDRLGVFGTELGRMMQTAGLGGLAQDLGFTGPKAGGPVRSGISSESYAAQQAQQAQQMGFVPGANAAGGIGSGSMGGMGPGSMGGMGPGTLGAVGPKGGIGSASMSFGSSAPSSAPAITAQVGKGMALGKAKKQDTLLAAMRAEGEIVDALPVSSRSTAGATAVAAAFIPANEAVHLSTIEKINVTLNRDGGVENVEIKGDLMLNITDESKAAIRIGVNLKNQAGFQLRTHPNIDKNLFSAQNILGLKDAGRPFPVGSPLGVLRWRLQTKDESVVPLIINCWPSESGNGSQVNVEYELIALQELRDVVIVIPTRTGSVQPRLAEIDQGDFAYNSRTQSVEWKIALIDNANRTGNLEFHTALMDPSNFFPVSAAFLSRATYLQLSIQGIVNAASNEPVKFSSDVSLSTEQYMVA